MDITLVVTIFFVGAAALGLWVVARFPSFGPTRITTSFLIVAAAFALLNLTQSATRAVAEGYGPGAALVFVVLPTVTLMFWSCARLIRAFAEYMAPFSRR